MTDFSGKKKSVAVTATLIIFGSGHYCHCHALALLKSLCDKRQIVGADFWEVDLDSNFSLFRVRRFTEWPGPLHWIAFPVEILTKPLIHWIPPPFSLKTPFFSLKSASSDPLPKNRLWNCAYTLSPKPCIMRSFGLQLTCFPRSPTPQTQEETSWRRLESYWPSFCQTPSTGTFKQCLQSPSPPTEPRNPDPKNAF